MMELPTDADFAGVDTRVTMAGPQLVLVKRPFWQRFRNHYRIVRGLGLSRWISLVSAWTLARS